MTDRWAKLDLDGELRSSGVGQRLVHHVLDESRRIRRGVAEGHRQCVAGQIAAARRQVEVNVGKAPHVSGVAAFGFFVELDTYFVEGLVHAATLTDDRYELVAHQHLLRGRRRGTTYRLGDAVRVRVASVSIERRQVDLVVA